MSYVSKLVHRRNVHDLNDQQLIQKFLSTDDDGYFVELLKRHSQLVFRRCVRMLRNHQDADDAAQAIWTKVYFALPNFQARSTFKTWLFRIVNNYCLNVIRAQKNNLDELKDNTNYEPDTSLTLEEKVANNIDVTHLLQMVSKEEKAILIMKYVDRYSYEDIAGQLNISVSSAKMRVARTKERLRKYANHYW
jgi:RNA polymerase sigma-70 factor, ECF subfamily